MEVKLPWVEKYRPQHISDIILPSTIKGYFTKKINSKEIPNLLIYSHQPGTGKSTIAKALCKETGVDYLYINISLNGGIDTLRDDISKYASCMSFDNNIKVVILDEFDGASMPLQKALRASIEEFVEVCRFIIVCNNINQVIEQIRSRCEKFHFGWSDKNTKEEMKPKILKRLCGILKIENIQYDKDVVEKIVDTNYPDIRSMIILLEQFSSLHNSINCDIFSFKAVDDELYKLILNKKVTEARKFIINNEYDYGDLYRALFDNYVQLLDGSSKKGKAILLINDYMYKHFSSAIDKEINFTALLIELTSV